MPQTQIEALSRALDVARLLSSTLDLGELLRAVLREAAAVVDAETASVLLLDDKTQELYFDVALGLDQEAAGVRLPLGQGIAGCVAQSRKSEIINDVRADARWSPKTDEKSGFKTRSILAVSMNARGRLIGVVEAINKHGDGGFTKDDLRVLEAFSSQAAVAIENARLFSSLQDEKLKLSTVFSETADGVVLTDAAGRVLLANAAARRFAPSADAATLDQALDGLALTPTLAEIMAGGEASGEFVAVREQPQRLILEGRLRKVAAGWLCVFRDETENWQKERLKRSFLSLISHKLKTPLTAINGFSEILAMELTESPHPSPTVAKAVKTIGMQGSKLAQLVDKLLNYAHLENPERSEPVACALGEVVGEAVLALAPWLKDRNAVVDVAAEPGVRVVADRGQLVEVVRNLIENAAKFDAKPEKRVRVSVAAEDRRAVLCVADTGRGIPPEDFEKVFSQFHQIEQFFTGQVDGWGLGLPYVKKVVESHGGTIELASRLERGTTVTCRFPRAEAKG